ncbi:MAG TPA: hypothetical protein VD704_00980 [Gaiellaceae bacterium]|nr:hypothetical protein [Gaiellaceae bacterium]
MSSPVDRPLKLGELLAETIRVYGDRLRAALGLGAVIGGGYLLAGVVPAILEVLVVSLAFTGTYAAAARIVSGDSFVEAWAQVGVRAPVLVVLTFVVAVPFALAATYLLFLVLAALWLALVGFSVPAAMLEREGAADGVFGRIAYALDRSLRLARAEYLHAAGVVAALIGVYLVVGILIGVALVGFADNGRLIAVALAQVVLAPLFFLGLSVLYYEQRARADVSSRGEAA